MLQFLGSVVSDPLMAGIIADPRVGVSRLTQLLLDIGEGRFSRTGQNFVRVLAENRRLPLVPAVAELFDRHRAELEGRSRVEVTTAFKLTPQQQGSIAEAMSKRLGRAVDITVKVDQTLIGGVIIRAGDLVIDGSTRGRLKQLALALG